MAFFYSHSEGWSPYWAHSARRPQNGLLYLPRVIVMMENSWWNEDWQGKPKFRRKPAPAPLSPPQIPLQTMGSNPGRRGGKPATNRLSYGGAI
jgi:hypothetical protein